MFSFFSRKRPCPPSFWHREFVIKNLKELLFTDINPKEGARLVLPFLSTKDRLELSVCCKELLQYRYQLSGVTILQRVRGNVSTSMKRALSNLLIDQKQLKHLRVVLTAVLLVVLERKTSLTTLDVSECEWCSEWETLDRNVAKCMVRALQSGNLSQLQEFNLRGTVVHSFEVKRVLSALGNGACPDLRRLRLPPRETYYCEDELGYEEDDYDPDYRADYGEELAKALESGHLSRLEELGLCHVNLGDGGALAVFRALQKGVCPELTKLNLNDTLLSDEEGEALASVLASGACRILQELDLACNVFGDGCLAATIGALGAGNHQALTYLKLGGLGDSAAEALAHLILSGNFCGIQHLGLMLDSGVGSILEAIKTKGLPKLLRLDLSFTEIDHDEVGLLADVVGCGAMPKLRVIDLYGTQLQNEDRKAIKAAATQSGINFEY